MKRILSVLPFLFAAVLALGQGKMVSGVISAAEDGLPVIGATILIKGTASGTVTDIDGTYAVNVPSNDAVLVISYTGLKTQEITVGDRTQIDVQMESSVSILDEVVVTGYGSQGRRVLTSAVSSVSAEELENLPTPNVDQMLQGRAAGVQVTANSGTPGGSMFVRVRGTTSITAGSDPLYVVDGIPIVTAPLESLGLGGSQTSPLSDLNPADIQSIEVLKDASATAIYGARAANGVVIITTKRGSRSQNAKVSLNTYYGFQDFWKDPQDQLVNAQQFEELRNEAARNNGGTEPYPNPGSGGADTRWAEEVFERNAPMHNIDLSISGGNDKVQYFISGNQFDQDGIIRNTNFTRRSGRINLDFKAFKDVKIGTSLLYARTSRQRQRNDDNTQGALGGVYFFPPNIPIFDANGDYSKFSIFENPVAAVNFYDLQQNVNRVLANAYGEWDIMQGLTFKTSFSVDYNQVKEDNYIPTTLNTGAAVNGSAYSAQTIDDNIIWENILTYQKGLGGEHYLTVLLGQSIQASDNEFTRASGQDFPSDDFRRITSAATQFSSSTGSEWGISSIFGRINYDFAGKYIVTVNVRRDGSSRFGEDNRWGTFPSIGAAWRLSEEAFLQNSSFINELKLRASYGITGNQNGIGNFASRGLWTGGANYVDNPGTSPQQLANPDLKWETTRQIDIGFDLGILDERVVVTFDWYNKYTEDLLLDVPLPPSTGFSSQIQNFGEVENQGVEFSISATPVRSSDFSWDINFNIAHNKAIVRKLFAPIEIYNRSPLRLEEGEALFSFWFHEQLSVDPQTGNPIWRVSEGEQTFNANRDRFIVGNAQPDVFGGITNNLRFKDFDFSMFWQYSYGNEQLNWNRFFQEHGGTRNTQFVTTQLDRWQQPGDITDIPRMTAANYAGNLRPSRFVEDGSYIRLKNISLGYSLPQSLISKWGIQKLRVYVTGQNVITITDYTGLDPELTGPASNPLVQGMEFYTYPQARVFTGGLTLIF